MNSKNTNLQNAKAAKNDEFYTSLTDIEKEIYQYRNHFKDKIIFCNCDDPKKSEFWKYFHMNFNFFGLKKLISTHYDTTQPTYKMEYTGGNDTDFNMGTITSLLGNGDFRSPECIEILKECDIVVSNPPFSLFREYLPTLMQYEKQFIVIGNVNAVSYIKIFTAIKDNKIWFGCSNPSDFMTPSGETVKLAGLCRWFTNLYVPKRIQTLDLIEKYTPEKYPKFDNYDAINVDKVSDIPVDYDGAMGVPITFIDKYNPEQFEILGLDCYIDGWRGNKPVINNKYKYSRIIIKHKKLKGDDDYEK